MIETWLYYEPSRDAGFQNLSHEVTHAERYIKSRNRRIYDKNIACNVHMGAWCTIKTFVNTKKEKEESREEERWEWETPLPTERIVSRTSWARASTISLRETRDGRKRSYDVFHGGRPAKRRRKARMVLVHPI